MAPKDKLCPVTLDVYVEKGCPACERSLALADRVRRCFPEVQVKVVDTIEPGEDDRLVLATPTFILNGERISLGNPSAAQLDAAIMRAMKEHAG